MDSGVDWQPAHGGQPDAVRLQAEDGQWVRVHDTPDPLADAHRQLADIPTLSPEVVVVVGAGLGYLTEAAATRWPETTVVVVEPLEAMAEAARARLPGLHASPRVRVLTGPDYAGAGDLWRVFDTPRSTGETPPIVGDPGLSRALPLLTKDAARVVGRAVTAARMNAQARAENAGRYVVNTVRNVRHIVHGANPERLRGVFSGLPAVVVGAGPSLDHTLDALRAVAGRALVIATDTAWRPLVRAGVSPHVVVALDPTPANGRHLMGVPAPVDTWVIAEGSVDPDALRALTGRVATFRVGDHHPWPWLQQLGVDRLQLRAWGSVLTSAFDLALVCGCGPITFVGADLAFTGGQPYCRGTSVEDDWARHTARGVGLRQVWRNTLASRPLVSEPGVTGDDVATAPHLVEFRNWLVARAGETAPGRVVNASGAGILVGPGIRQAALRDVLAAHAECDGTLRRMLHEALDTPTEVARARAVSEALIALGTCGEGTPSPLDEWVTFGRPTLARAELVDAARAGATALAAAGPQWTATRALVPLRWHVADRVAAMRARLTGDHAGLDGGAPPVPRSRGEAIADATQLITRVLETPVVVTSVGDDVASGSAAETVPLSCRFEWTADAAPLVARLEEALLDAAAPALRRQAAVADDYFTGSIGPVRLSHVAAPGVDDTLDRAARTALLAERLSLCACATPAPALTATATPTAAAAAASRRNERLIAAAACALADPALVAPSHTALRVDVDGVPVRLPILVDGLMRALTGTIALAQDGDDPRLAFLAGGRTHVEPVVLTSRGLAMGWGLAPADHDRAVFVPAQADYSLRLTPTGEVEPGLQWPGPITGEMPWGPAGGTIAWNAVTGTAHWRAADTAPCQSAPAPFKPMHLALAPDGAPYWTDASANVWRWTPGQAPVRVASLPAAGIPRFEGPDLIVTPMPRDAHGRAARQRLRHEWRIGRVTGARTVVEIGPEGQCAKVAAGPEWLARTHPCADLIGLERPGSAPLWLACYAPLAVAWAGSSLIVTAGGATVLLFPRLLDALDAAAVGPRLAV